MSDFSLTLVLQIKTSKIINDMTKVQQNLRKSPLLVEYFSFWTNSTLFCFSHWDRYLGMMTAMTQVPVPTTLTTPCSQVPVPMTTAVAAAESSAIVDISSKNLPSICDSFGSDFGCLSQTRLSVACSSEENQQKVCFVRNIVVSLQCQSEQTTFERHEIRNNKSNN